ncbi:MAG: hypothetical protein LBL59_04745 [Xanthomonadaceae bacterium]|jgi:hypothetical protein|nr:hypothetical protein [Xanthomonadaceae bacterium]
MPWALACLCLLLGACRAEAPEQRLRTQLTRLQNAVESHDAANVLKIVADDFIGNDGMDRIRLRQMITAQMRLNQSIGATMGPPRITMAGEDMAVVEFTVMLTGGSGRFLPDQAQAYTVRSGWRIENGDWKVYRARWEAKF